VTSNNILSFLPQLESEPEPFAFIATAAASKMEPLLVCFFCNLDYGQGTATVAIALKKFVLDDFNSMVTMEPTL
jgi:hypothetical protein